jgi:hypothetical protein
VDQTRNLADPGSAPTAAEDTTTRCGRVCRAALFLAIGVAAGVAAFVAIGRYGASFQLPPEIRRLAAQERPTLEEWALINAAEIKQTYQNTALSVAILGGVAGAFLGLAAGLRRRTFRASTGGMVGGVLLGAAFGAAGGLLELYVAYWLWPMDFERTFKTMATHSIAFLAIGAGIGLAAGLTARRVGASLGVILAASLIAGLVYPGLAAAMFPIANTDAVVPRTFGPLLLWTVMPLALMGLALGRTKVARGPAIRT